MQSPERGAFLHDRRSSRSQRRLGEVRAARPVGRGLPVAATTARALYCLVD
jgi:hypothetical protein